jgi:hypothetical protein
VQIHENTDPKNDNVSLAFLANILDLIDTPHRPVGVGNVDGGHIEACTTEKECKKRTTRIGSRL